MAEYRAYTVGRDGHFIGYEPLVCADDAEAIEKATGLLDEHDIELWSGPRFIIRLSASKKHGAGPCGLIELGWITDRG